MPGMIHVCVGGMSLTLHSAVQRSLTGSVKSSFTLLKKKSSVEHKGKQSPDGTRIFYFIYIKVRTSEVTEALLQIFKSGLLQAPSSLSIKDGEDELYSALSFFFLFFFFLSYWSASLYFCLQA